MSKDERWALYHKWSSGYDEALTAQLLDKLASHDKYSRDLKVCTQLQQSSNYNMSSQ